MFPRLHVVTDALDTVRGVVASGPPGPVAVQIRVKTSDRDAYELARAVAAIVADPARATADFLRALDWQRPFGLTGGADLAGGSGPDVVGVSG